MRLPGNKKLVAVVAAVILLTGGAGAFAATQLSSNPRQAYLNDVARRLHVTPAALTSAMKQAMIDQINAARKAGKLTAAQASAAESRIKSGHTAGGLGGFGGAGGAGGPGGPGGPRPGFAPGAWRSGQGQFACGGSSTTTSTTTTSTTTARCKGGPPRGLGGHFGRFSCRGQSSKTTTSTTTTSTSTTSTTAKPCPGAPAFKHGPGFGQHQNFGQHAGFGMGHGFGPGLFGLGESAVTGYLGISAAKLRSDLADGKSLAKIASGTSGKSVSGLESALMAAAKTQLHKAVSAGRMTSAQEAKALSALSSLESKLVNGSFKFPGAGRFHGSRTP